MGTDRVDGFARAADGSLVHTYWDGYWGSWPYANRWWPIGGTLLLGAPAAASNRPGVLDVFVQGVNRELARTSWGDGSWSWSSFSQVASCMWHRPDVWPADSADNATWNRVLWSGSTPAVVGQNGDLALVLRGHDGNLWFRRQVLVQRYTFGGTTPTSNGVAPPACPCGSEGQECCVGQFIGQTCRSEDSSPSVLCNAGWNSMPSCGRWVCIDRND